jgi:hypothetical protein
MEGQINYLDTESTFAFGAVVSVVTEAESVLITAESVVGVVDFAPPQAARVAIATIAITFLINVLCLIIIKYTI